MCGHASVVLKDVMKIVSDNTIAHHHHHQANEHTKNRKEE